MWTPAPKVISPHVIRIDKTLSADISKLADWLESYAHSMELNVWLSSTIENMKEVPGKGWSVTVKRGDGTTRTFAPRHVVFAHGFGGGKANMPKYPGMVS